MLYKTNNSVTVTKTEKEMNANELADEFKEENNDWNEDNLRHWGKQTEAMLRQQALEIQALHQILGYEGIEVGKEYLDECVEDLRKAQEK